MHTVTLKQTFLRYAVPRCRCGDCPRIAQLDRILELYPDLVRLKVGGNNTLMHLTAFDESIAGMKVISKHGGSCFELNDENHTPLDILSYSSFKAGRESVYEPEDETLL